MKTSIYLSIFLSIFLSVSLNAQVNSNKDVERNEGIKRNAMYNLEEIKVRWKKAALENCPGVPCSFTCGTSTINDVDGNTYNTVLIGTQCWTKENLKVTKYNDGTSIPLDASGGSAGNGGGETWSSQTTGAYTIFGNESSTGPNATNYGFLYNWYSAAGIITNGGSPTKNICPSGWHVPTDAEWTTLTDYLGGALVAGAGGKMKSTSILWNTPNTGATNSSGFTALPGGYRNRAGSFFNTGNSAYFWSATENSNDPWFYNLSNIDDRVFRSYLTPNSKRLGLSIRCLKN